MASLPRPSRPAANPPSGPLPSIPTPKARIPAGLVPDSTDTDRPSTPQTLPQPTSLRNISTSSIPTTNSPNLSSNSSVTNLTPTDTSPSDSSTPTFPTKIVRKTISYGSFPRPPGVRSPTVSQSPTSTGPNPAVPNRSTSLVNVNGRSLSMGSHLRATGPIAHSLKSNRSRESVAESIKSTSSSKWGDENGTGDRAPPSRGRMSTMSKSDKDKGNVIVSVRVRPEAAGSDANKAEADWLVESRRSLISYKGKEGGEYFFDNVFATNDKNAKVYDASAKRLVRRVMDGYHGTVFAYGMTGTGKTFSMQGTAKSPGVIPLAITDIFSFIRETPTREFLLRVSYLEIYNEKIYDLLSAPIGPVAAGAPPQEEIKLREDSKRGVYATPLKEEIVQSPTQLLRIIARGDHARRTSSTQYNARSSRSHAVVQIVVESRERVPGLTSNMQDSKRPVIVPGGVRVSTLSLIDLAGSERAAENKERRAEGAHINKSLLTLGTVISKLSGTRDKHGNPTDKDGKHLPYRDSKLTRLLQSALAGNALISILCTIQLGAVGSSATAATHVGETLNTLKFASRAKNNIVSHAKKAEEAHIGDATSRALLDRYRFEIAELRKQLENQKLEKQKEKDDEEEKAKELEAEQRHEEQMLEMQLARTALKERIEHLNRLILSSKSIGVNSGIPSLVGRTSSSLSLRQPRSSVLSNGDSVYIRSIRSSSSTQTFDGVLSERMSSASLATTVGGRDMSNTYTDIAAENEANEDDGYDDGEGHATLSARVRALQADLADRNRYIATLEKRLLQARRSSRSRVSMTFASHRVPLTGPDEEIGGTAALLRDKDAEIAELRGTIEDQARSLGALRSSVRKLEVATGRSMGAGRTSTSPTTITSQRSHSAKTSLDSGGKRSIESTRSMRTTRGGRSSSEQTILSRTQEEREIVPHPARLGHGGRGNSVDEVTRILDEMILEQPQDSYGSTENGNADAEDSSSSSSTIETHNRKRDTIRLSTLGHGTNGSHFPMPPSAGEKAKSLRRSSLRVNGNSQRRASLPSGTSAGADSNSDDGRDRTSSLTNNVITNGNALMVNGN